MLDIIGDAEWRDLLVAWLALGKTVPQVIFPLLPYLLGGVKQEIEHSGTVEHVRISEIRQALGVVAIRELNAPRKASGE